MEFSSWEVIALMIALVATVTLFCHSLYGKLRVVLKGKFDRVRTDHLGRRLRTAVTEVLAQTRVIGGRPVAGTLHAAVFAGFIFFAPETIDHFLKPYGFSLLQSILGDGVVAFKGVVAVWAILVSVAIVGLAFRRFAMVKFSPDPKSYSSGLVALLILLLMLTYLYSYSGSPLGLEKANWWVHAAIILVFPHLILRSKHFHIIMAPIDIFFRTERLGDLLPMNLDLEELESSEEEMSLGLECLDDLSWKQRMDFVTCVECRRCTDHCPANISGQELDPRGFILMGRASIYEMADDQPVIGNVISETALGQCTSCGACEAICPVGIEHLQILTGAKRAQALAMGTGMVAADFLKTIERSGNAFGLGRDQRDQLIQDLEIPYFEKGKTEFLLWLGCVWGYNADARSAVAALVRIFRQAGTSFGVLTEESCSGHHSRRQGEELQFQTLARENMERLGAAEVQKIVTPCPHCLHTISREYPSLDSGFRPTVMHHSQLIENLLDNGSIRLRGNGIGTVATTYHDPCYLGRFEDVLHTPRNLIARAGLSVLEMERSGRRAMCCGGGSAGFMSQEERVPRRVDEVRKDEVRGSGAKLLVVGCPECKMMLDAAVEETKDLAEVVAEALA